MKKGAIITGLLVCLCFSCSMVDETAFDARSVENVNTVGNGLDAVISVDLSLANLKTRVAAGEVGEDKVTEMNIRNGLVFLLVKKTDGTYDVEQSVSLLSAKDAASDAAIAEFLTKSGTNKYLYAVANLSADAITRLKGCATLDEVEAATLGADDLRLYPKAVAEPTQIDFTDGMHFAKTTGDDGRESIECISPLSLTVDQRAARIELTEFVVAKKEAEQIELDVQLTQVELINANTAGTVGAGEAETSSLANVTKQVGLSAASGNLITDGAIPFESFAYTYKDKEEAQLALRLTYQVGKGQVRTATFPIKGLADAYAVAAGYIYKVKVKATVVPEERDIDIQFWVQPWKDGGSLGEFELVKDNN